MAMRVKEELAVCQDCLMVIANGDYSGIAEEDLARVTKATDALGRYACADGDDLGFSWRPCECCEGLAGDRYKVVILEPVHAEGR